MISYDRCRINSCGYKYYCYDGFCVKHFTVKHPQREVNGMSTETINQQIPAGSWTLDNVHSSIHFSITHNGVSTFRSGFTEFEATLTGGEQPRLEGTVDVASIDVDEPQLKGHLLSPDFFDAERNPRLRFSSTELSVADDGAVGRA